MSERQFRLILSGIYVLISMVSYILISLAERKKCRTGPAFEDLQNVLDAWNKQVKEYNE